MTVYNFCAGPAAMPRAVLAKAKSELLNWQEMGISVMEVSHRSSEYQSIAKKAEADLRQLLAIPDDYAVLFMHGGASAQFSAIALTLLKAGKKAQYVVNGTWSTKAAAEAERFGEVVRLPIVHHIANKMALQTQSDWPIDSDACYLHYTPNETIEGLRIAQPPKCGIPVIADMSSCILAETIDINDYDLIYAGAQKNIGPAGMTLVIVKKSLFEQMQFDRVPKIYHYQQQVEQGSMLNTPPTYTWYLAGLVFEWLLEQGGVAEMERRAIEKSKLLYDFIDASDFYHNPVHDDARSRMNIPFTLAEPALDNLFLQEAKEAGLLGLKGHRSVGGMRASLYNAMPVEGVKTLVEFMKAFERRHG